MARRPKTDPRIARDRGLRAIHYWTKTIMIGALAFTGLFTLVSAESYAGKATKTVDQTSSNTSTDDSDTSQSADTQYLQGSSGLSSGFGQSAQTTSGGS